ncbi:B-cell antigen receptor complex-associated protein beta chain [Megalops cyprinoides]|uniref:B-cell antigen receptor complex-associated protein beta chain n=1 Tax=Megalops cyprinoides TaxID=118141 RepID=UPI001864C531|nr:B-cell antigen receptor complex-associated protein beta chain [Megalops cyprinoides]
MQCVFLGFCLIALVNFSVSKDVLQKPRFLGVKSRRYVRVYCIVPEEHSSGQIQWYKSPKHDSLLKNPIVENERFEIALLSKSRNAWIGIKMVQPEDSGVYFCKINNVWGSGTELQVYRHIDTREAMRRTKMKDVMIIIQALLLVSCVLAPLLLHLKKAKEEDAIYEEPEEDHTYEGLEIEHCGLYEDIPALSQPSEATWEQTESPRGCSVSSGPAEVLLKRKKVQKWVKHAAIGNAFLEVLLVVLDDGKVAAECRLDPEEFLPGGKDVEVEHAQSMATQA